MLGQIWSSLTRKPAATGISGPQLDPIVKYRLALYLTTTTASGSSQTAGVYVRKVGTPAGS